jgi:hypothetical protein
MSNDELLAKINEASPADKIDAGWQSALRAVVELCDKWETKGSYCLPIDSVIQAIEKELG